MPKKKDAEIAELKKLIARAKTELRHPTYGLPWAVDPEQIPMRDIEMQAFAQYDLTSKTKPREWHFWQYVKRVWPNISINPWLERGVEALCSDKYAYRVGDTVVRAVSFAGCAASGKTFLSGFYGVAWWLPVQDQSILILTSTTRQSLRRRVWPIVQQMREDARHLPYDEISECAKNASTATKLIIGHMIESKTMVQATKGDDKHAIFAMPVAKGELVKAVANLKGMHARRITLVIDEAEGVPEAILEAIPNLLKACEDMTLMFLGNPVSRLDAFGRVCEPAAGWASVSADDEWWPTKGVSDWQVPPGVCIHFDGGKSPNVVGKRTRFPYLYTYENWKTAQAVGEGRLSFWQYDRGFWPPASISNTVFTEQMVEQYHGYDDIVFRSESRPIGFLDPAFGGDDCMLRFAMLGNDDEGKLVVRLTDRLIIPIPEKLNEEIDYHIARRTIDECRKRGVRPEWFGLDATGIGRGVGSIIASEWSADILRTEWGSAASDLPSSDTDPRPANEVYANKVTEMWFSCQEFLRGGQLRMLDTKVVKQFCTREYEYKGRRIKLENKEDVKAKLNQSPDDADAVAGLIEVARQLGAVARLSGSGRRAQNAALESAIREHHEVYEEQNSYLDEGTE